MNLDEGSGVGCDGIIGYHYRETIHSPSHHYNDNAIYYYLRLGVSAGDGRGEFRSQETSHIFPFNRGFYRLVPMEQLDIGLKRKPRFFSESWNNCLW